VVVLLAVVPSIVGTFAAAFVGLHGLDEMEKLVGEGLGEFSTILIQGRAEGLSKEGGRGGGRRNVS
jgi:hypothetical protein